jgi:hypothetical protein
MNKNLLLVSITVMSRVDFVLTLHSACNPYDCFLHLVNGFLRQLLQTVVTNTGKDGQSHHSTDMGNHRVRKITPGGTVSTFTGSGSAGLRTAPAQLRSSTVLARLPWMTRAASSSRTRAISDYARSLLKAP